MHSQILIVFVVFAACISSGYGIKCYHCNSNDSPGCSDPFDDHHASEFLRDCNELVNGTGIHYTYCRKTTQKTSLKGMKDENKRVIRTCGYLNDSRLALEDGDDPNALKCFRRAGTFDVEMLYCACYKDDCNPAGRAMPGAMNLIAALTAGGILSLWMNRSA